MIVEKFDNAKHFVASEWKKNDDLVQDSSSLTSQFKCLKSKRKDQKLYTVGGISENKRKDMKSTLFPHSKGEEGKNFTPFSIIWIILPVMNLFWEIAMDIVGVLMFFVKEIFNSTYNSISKPFRNIFGYKQGSDTSKNAYCFHFSWFRYLALILCPPMAVFMAYGLIGWYQVIICCFATLFYYFPGLAYAIIVIGRSEVNTYMKKYKEGDGCDKGDKLGKGFFISSEDNKPKCIRKSNETCSPEGVEVGAGHLDCCAQPFLKDGIWMRNDTERAKDSAGNEIENYEEGELVCKNDTKKIKMPKGICDFKIKK
jgi:uncharacterized membrane protein YqaE (UPF0057 family)